ncbi:STAS domain-containing protein [Blastomonas natatoria]|uniref:STAS domain-containing protein n=1 Tax=Blastomonas natatoria TaxID=34015 RepID=A0A2V3VCB4_9SPHN|nr:STAS domain-containing protein [Blastomonas natatoria]PXW79413.1 STAS domain-containing protein [Blastomonas natatoria]
MTQLTLPSRCDRAAAIALHPELRDKLKAGPVTLDGSDVSALGQAMLQLLLSARQTANRTGQSLTITPSEKMRSTLTNAGADPDMLCGNGMAS